MTTVRAAKSKCRPLDEKWKPIKDFEELYLISNYGRVKAIKGNPNKFKNKDCIMTPQLSRKVNPYYKVMLRKNGKSYAKKIHRLVAEHFLKKNNLVVNHKDGNSLNNFVSNLEWCSQKDNVLHAIKRKTHVLPDWKKIAKLNEKEIKEMRQTYVASRGTLSWVTLGNMYSVSRTQARRIINKQCWRNI